jgi:hypothetical protein
MPAASDPADIILILILVFGGDGTIHRHLSRLVKLGLPVLVIPAGSGNDFARALGFRRVRDSPAAWRRFGAWRRTKPVGLDDPQPSTSHQPTLLVAFANTAIYGGGMKIAPQAQIDDGRRDGCVIGASILSDSPACFPQSTWATICASGRSTISRPLSLRVERKLRWPSSPTANTFAVTPAGVRIERGERGAVKVLTPQLQC